jgi:hypothetical protein
MADNGPRLPDELVENGGQLVPGQCRRAGRVLSVMARSWLSSSCGTRERSGFGGNLDRRATYGAAFGIDHIAVAHQILGKEDGGGDVAVARQAKQVPPHETRPFAWPSHGFAIMLQVITALAQNNDALESGGYHMSWVKLPLSSRHQDGRVVRCNTSFISSSTAILKVQSRGQGAALVLRANVLPNPFE